MLPFFKNSWNSLKEELLASWNAIRSTRWSLGLLFAIFCVFFVIVANVILMIAVNFWLVIFPAETAESTSKQVAIQVVTMSFITLIFLVAAVVFTIIYGALPLWHILVDTNRIGGPLYRFFLLFCSGLTNGVSSVLGVYAATYTPQFIQAVLLCCIPFSAQAWTVIFIPIERKRNYLSMLFIGSFVLFVAGILLSSLSAFLDASVDAQAASWSWALMYLLSAIIFGLWCVVQRLYLDAVVRKETLVAELPNNGVAQCNAKSQAANETNNLRTQQQSRDHDDGAVTVRCEMSEPTYVGREDYSRGDSTSATKKGGVTKANLDAPYIEENPHSSDEEVDEEMQLTVEDEVLMKREWASQSVDGNAAKVILLLFGLFFQLLVSVVLFPVDAIPWFGTSDSAQHAWEGFCNSVDFIFASWFNVRYGLLYSLGFAMSFIGCTYLNEHSPTLASVVLQLAGPITSLVIIIVPQWNVYKLDYSVGQQVGGVILLLVAALLYHLWEQESLRRMIAAADAQRLRQQQQRQEQGVDEVEENLTEAR